MHRARFAPVASLVATLAFFVAFLVTTRAHAIGAIIVNGGYPQRSNADSGRIITGPGPTFAADANNPTMGINRKDCFDTSQEWRFTFTNVPTDASTIEIWVSAQGANCTDPLARKGETTTTATCWKVNTFPKEAVALGQVVSIHPIDIIRGIDKGENFDDPGKTNITADQVCNKTGDMPPQAITLWVLPLQSGATRSVPSDSGAVQIGTVYDIAGPSPPGDLSILGGNTLVKAQFTAVSSTSVDFHGYRFYCFPYGSGDAGTSEAGLSTKSFPPAPAPPLPDATDETGDAIVDETAVTDSAPGDEGGTAGDTGAGDSSDATSSEASTEGGIPANCPSGTPFQPGQLPNPATMDQYICDEEGSFAGSINIKNLTNGKRVAVAVAATDNQGNSGAFSNVSCATPDFTDDFYTVYRRDGGTAGGGYCAYSGSSNGPWAIALGALAAALGIRVARRNGRNGSSRRSS